VVDSTTAARALRIFNVAMGALLAASLISLLR